MTKVIALAAAFNFADVSDIAATNPALAAKVANASQDKIDMVVGIFTAAAECSVSVLSIAQIEVVAIRSEIELPAAATIRKYINTAVEQGSLKKVTRQTYALADADVEIAADAEEADEEEDDLAGIE